jgi:hypothetical protein
MRALTIAARTAALVLLMSAAASAQWLNRPTEGIPRTPDGKPNLAAPVPRTPDGKPELAGLWRPSPGLTGDIARNLKPGDVPFQPWAETLYNIDIQITIDDPKAYTKPWTVTQPLAFQADTELLEYICNENNKYFELVHDFGK